ncbi:MAG: hypothetical protein IKO78_05355 [Bacilli bacterium]|nr:hypothetical protein [Bacilli bacterium]
MINAKELLMEICEDERVLDDNQELIESGILDSYAYIMLFSKLDDLGLEIQPTRLDKSLLKTPAGIQELINRATKK